MDGATAGDVRRFAWLSESNCGGTSVTATLGGAGGVPARLVSRAALVCSACPSRLACLCGDGPAERLRQNTRSPTPIAKTVTAAAPHSPNPVRSETSTAMAIPASAISPTRSTTTPHRSERIARVRSSSSLRSMGGSPGLLGSGADLGEPGPERGAGALGAADRVDLGPDRSG